jgi:hypothetical protein
MIHKNPKIIPITYFLLFFIVFLNITSCKITDCTKSISIEIMKPAVSALHENVKTVAILNRAIFDNDSLTLYNFGEGNLPCDTTVNDFELSNYCLNGLTTFFEQEAYFLTMSLTARKVSPKDKLRPIKLRIYLILQEQMY